MDRREFLALSGLAGLVPLLGPATAAAAAESAAGRELYELREYQVESEEQVKGIETFLAEAAIPALGRIGIGPVGVFRPREGLGSLWVLLPHRSFDSLRTLVERLGADEEFLSRGAAFLDAPRENAAYTRVESSLLEAFTGMPRLERPVRNEGRVFQLRTYESSSVKNGQKKIEMFNTAEISIFRRVGLHPVFYGETLIGPKMPCLTYMIGFESAEEQKAAWGRFGKDPEWQALRSRPEYADRKILSGITNRLVAPSPVSQI